MTLLIEGHGGFHKHTVFRCPDAVQHGSNIAMVADIIRTSAIDRNCRNAPEHPGGVSGIRDTDMQDLHILIRRDKRSQFRAKT